MKKILVNPVNYSNFTGAIITVITDLTVATDNTWARARGALQGAEIYDLLLFGKKDKNGTVIPIPAENLDLLRKGSTIKANARMVINPTENDGKTYENKSIVLDTFEPYQVPTFKFTGRLLGEIKKTELEGGKRVYDFRLAHYRGKNEDGSFKPSHFENVRFFGEELPSFVQKGADLQVEGVYVSKPRESDGKRYANEAIIAHTIVESKAYLLVLDDNDNVIGHEELTNAQAAAPAAGTSAIAPAAPAPEYMPGTEPSDDCPY